MRLRSVSSLRRVRAIASETHFCRESRYLGEIPQFPENNREYAAIFMLFHDYRHYKRE